MWIKQPNDNNAVPGTVLMVADDDCSDSNGLKQTSNGVVLNPQPQDDPNDPLNWPIWRRDISLLTVSIYALLGGGMTPLLAPVMNTLHHDFDKPLHTLTFLVGALMISMGVGSALFAPIAVKFGKRLVYLLSMMIFFAGLVWGANAKSYGSLMGARVLSGIGASPAESLPSTTIAEIYFAHERAYRLGIYTLLLLGGKNLSPLASGFIANRLGWHWIFWIAAIICAAAFVGTFLFIHETFWDRTPVPDVRSQRESEAAERARKARNLPPFNAGERESSGIQLNEAPLDSSDEKDAEENMEKDTENTPNSAQQQQQIARKPFFRNLAVYSGKKTETKLWMIFVRPAVLYSYIPVLYATLMYGTSVVWLSVIAETINSIFTSEPYHFKSTSVGLLYVGTFSGGVLGSLVAGRVSDWLVRQMCRHNKGVYEPEFRLVMILPVMVATSIGLMGFGWSTQVHDHWIVPAVFLGVLGFGTSLASTVSITYVVDCYRKYALEALVSLNFFKNVLGLAFSIFVPYFYESSGSKTSYIVYGSIVIGLSLFAIPLYHYGKVIRHWHSKHAWVDAFYSN